VDQSNNLVKKPVRSRDLTGVGLIVFSVFAVCLLAANLYFFIVSINKPFMGVTFVLNSNTWSVGSVDLNGTAYQAGVREGDIPTEINNEPAQSFLEKFTAMGVVYGLIITDITVTDESGQIRSADLRNSRPSFATISELVMWFVTCLIFWIVGFYVFYKKPRNFAARIMCLCSLFFGLTLGANIAGERQVPLAVYVAAVALVVSPTLLLHFFMVLPEERGRLRASNMRLLIYIPSVITMILVLLVGFIYGQPTPWFRNFRLVEALVILLAVVGVVVFNFMRAGSPRTRQQMKIMFIGTASALVPFLLLNILYIGVLKQNSVPYGIHVLFLSMIPISMGYAVAKQHLFDIDFIIRRGVIYSLISIIMAFVLTAVMYFVTSLNKTFGVPEQIILALILGIIATVFFGPLMKWMEAIVDKFFFKDRYDYRLIIQSLANSLNSLKGFSDTSRLLVGTTANTLNLSGACLFVRTLSGSYELSSSQGNFVTTDMNKLLYTLTFERNKQYEFPNSASEFFPEISFLVPLVTGEQEVGMLCLSPKANKQGFSSNDIYLLQGIASVGAAAIRSAMLIRDVSMRDTFISIASHELRTPLTNIIGFAELLMKKDPPENTRKQWLKLIYESGKRITVMVDNLLNVSRIQSGKVVLRIETTKIDEVLQEQIDISKEGSNKHQFVTHIDSELPEASIDRDKFGHVIANLLSNAVKYSPNGGTITISASMDMLRPRIIVAVADEGIGISPKDQVSLFTTFHRIQRPETIGIPGSGLGLYIAKEWTEAMGGEIWLKSELNKGTTFFVGIKTASKEKEDTTENTSDSALSN